MNKPVLASSELLKRSNDLLDTVMDKKDLKNDAALSRFLAVAPPVISKIRNGKLPVGSTLMIRIHEFADMAFSEIRNFIPRAA